MFEGIRVHKGLSDMQIDYPHEASSKPSILVASMRPFDTATGVWPGLVRNDQENRCLVSLVLAGQNELTALRKCFPGATCVPNGFPGFREQFPAPSGRAFKILSAMTGHEDFLRLKSQVLSMLNRHDTTGAFRLIDREVFFYETFFGLGGLMIWHGVTHAFFEITPHVVLEFIAFWLAKKLGLRVLFLQPVPVAGVSIPRQNIDERFPTGTGHELGPGFEEELTHFKLQLDNFVERLSSGNAFWVQRYVGPELKKLERKSPQLLKKFGRFLELSNNPNSAGVPGITNLPARVFGLLQSVLIWAHRRSFELTRKSNSNETLPAEPFLLYALTHEPERTWFPEALPWESQFECIAALASMNLGSKKILVKEHETQYVPGRVGYGSRSAHFYGIVDRLPNVQVLSSQMGAQGVLALSEGVVTATGTICVEAALMGKPAYYFGNPWWEGFPGTQKISRRDFTDGRLPDCPRFERIEYEKWAENLLESSVPSTANVPPEVFSSKYVELPAGYADYEANELTRLIDRFLFSEGGEK